MTTDMADENIIYGRQRSVGFNFTKKREDEKNLDIKDTSILESMALHLEKKLNEGPTSKHLTTTTTAVL